MENIIKESVSKVIKNFLTEGLSKRIFHYVSIRNFYKMCSTNRLYFKDSEKGLHHLNMRTMSTTRQKNSTQGFPYMMTDYEYGGTRNNGYFGWYLIRMEMDGEAVTNLEYSFRNKRTRLKGAPFDFLGATRKADGEEVRSGRAEVTNNIDGFDDEEVYYQPFAQAEDRVFSKKAFVDGFDKVIRRIDIYLDTHKLWSILLNAEGKVIKDIYDDLMLLRQGFYNWQDDFNIHLYDIQSKFDMQRGKEIGIEVVSDIIRQIKYHFN